jgi:hypothetical protein
MALPTHPGAAQIATAVVEENIRAEPAGVILGRVQPGATLSVLSRSADWAEVDLEGWVWARSLQLDEREGFDLVVSEGQGENLRMEPQGTILARLDRGTLMKEVGRTPGWIRVRRTVWIWGESLRSAEAAPGSARADPPVVETPAPQPPSEQPLSAVQAPRGGLPILSAPDGDTLARVLGGTDVPVVGREGGWARVRVEGWVWLPGGEPAEAPSIEMASISPEDVTREPNAHRGRLVTWRLQFISLEHAEAVRTDFYEGEPFLLTRTAEGQGAFIYVAVPRDRVSEVEGLTPLERIDVVGRIRVGSSALTGSPVLDLVEVRRGGSIP